MRKIKLLLGVGILALAVVGNAENQKILVINKGLGGHSTIDGLKRFQTDVVDLAPDWLILYFGMNDSHSRKRLEPGMFRINLQTMIDQADTGGIKNIIMVTPNPVHQDTLMKRVDVDHPGRDDLNAYLLKFDAIVRDLAKSNE